MGSFSELLIDGYPVYSAKNSYYESVVNVIFQPEDFIVEKRLNTSRNKLVWGDAYEKEKGYYTFKGFQQKALVCRQRLEIFGTDMKAVKKDFTRAKKFAKEEGSYDFPVEKVSFQQYLDAIKYILNNKLIDYEQLFTNLHESLITTELGLLGVNDAEHIYLLLSLLDDNSIVEYDLTEVLNGWVKEKDVFNIKHEKIIILTEGKTDVEFIQASLKLLYPHLFPYYHFINFEEYKMESNASALGKLVLSFAAANIKHPIIVLFDNDTTGIAEMKRINPDKLPENIVVIRLPDISLAKNYPTIGPSGKKKMNVNGLACGIEMYLGTDILTVNNSLLTVQWVGYNDKENKYQGQLLSKSDIQKRFRKKLKDGNTANFGDMDAVLQHIFNAFRKK